MVVARLSTQSEHWDALTSGAVVDGEVAVAEPAWRGGQRRGLRSGEVMRDELRGRRVVRGPPARARTRACERPQPVAWRPGGARSAPPLKS